MKKLVVVFMSLAIFGCASPYDRCVAEIQENARDAQRNYEEAKADSDRGFRLVKSTREYVCIEYDASQGKKVEKMCKEQVETPVSVAPEILRARLLETQKVLYQNRIAARSGNIAMKCAGLSKE